MKYPHKIIKMVGVYIPISQVSSKGPTIPPTCFQQGTLHTCTGAEVEVAFIRIIDLERSKKYVFIVYYHHYMI